MSSKVYGHAASALEGVVFDGMTVMSGGFGLSRQFPRIWSRP